MTETPPRVTANGDWRRMKVLNRTRADLTVDGRIKSGRFLRKFILHGVSVEIRAFRFCSRAARRRLE